MDSTVQAFCHYQRCALFLAILFPLEASEDLVPVNTSGAQHIVCKVWGWKIGGRKREACMHSLSLPASREPRLVQHETGGEPNHLYLQGDFSHGLLLWRFLCLWCPTLAAVLALEASKAPGVEVVLQPY